MTTCSSADVVAALLAADVALAERGTAVEGPYNVGTGVEVDVNDLAERLGRVAGDGAQIEDLPERPGEVNRVAIDPGSAWLVLCWLFIMYLCYCLLCIYERACPD